MKKDDVIRDNLINEIRFLLHQGKQRNEIVNLLSAKGNSPTFINKLIDYTYQQQSMNKSNYHSEYNPQQTNIISDNQNVVRVEHTHKLSGGTFVFISLFFVILFGSGIFLFLSQKEGDSYLLDYEVQLTKNSLNAGDEVGFDTRYSNMGSKGSYDVFAKYQVINAKQEVIMEWEDTKAVSNVQSYYIHEIIPKNTPAGKYYVYSEVNYGNNQKATARTLYFDLINIAVENNSQPLIDPPEDEPTKDEPPEDESATDDNIPINETSEDNITDITPDEPTDNEPLDDDPRYSDDPQEVALAIIAEAKTYATSDPQNAANLCFNLTERKLIDNCFQQLAKVSDNYNFCKEIKESAAKDFCYISYVLDMGDYEKCDYIISEKTKKSCRVLNPDYKGE